MLSAATGVDGKSKAVSETRSLLGSYLAGRVARGQNDTEAAASYYREALVRDPGNEVLIEQSFLMELTEGNWPRGEQLARELSELQPPRRMAHAFMGLVDFKAQRYAEADEHFKAASANPIGELTSTLARAWLYQAQDKTQEALALLDAPKQPEWAQYYLRYHRALLADQAGRRAEARAAYERIPKNDQRTLRMTLAYARHAANAGDPKLALSVLKAHVERVKSEGHPIARALQEQIEAGERPELLIKTPIEGMAEAFYGLGEALTGEGGVSVGAVYLQFALYLTPDFPFALAALANAYETTKRYDDAHRRLRPHSQGHAAADEHRHPQGAEPQPARARRRGAEAAGRDRARESQGRPAARRARQHHARPQALSPRPSTTTRAPSP